MTKRLFVIFVVAVALGGCNKHPDDQDSNNNESVEGVTEAEVLSNTKVAMWVEYDDNTYDYRLTRVWQSGDLELVGFKFPLERVSAAIVTAENFMLLEFDDLVEVYEVMPGEENISHLNSLIRNARGLPVGWQPNLFPTSESQAADMQYLLQAFICAMGLNLYNEGGYVPETLFRKVQDTAYYEWSNPGHNKYVFVVYR